jgi:hypothetical protein
MLAMGALIYEILLNEGKVTDHLKRNWGKYAAGGAATAAALALAEPELTHQYHMHALKQLDREFVDDVLKQGFKRLEATPHDKTPELTPEDMEILKGKAINKMKGALSHSEKIENANARNLLNHRDKIHYPEVRFNEPEYIKRF